MKRRGAEPVDRSDRRPPSATLLLGLAMAALLACMGWVPGLRATPAPALLVWGGAFAAYAAALAAHGRAPVGVGAAWTVGLACRGVLFPLEPHFSDDIYRYLWDGWVRLHGVDPYAFAPADEALAGLRTSWHALINHPEVPTIYPPAAQAAFLLLAAAGPSVPVFKAAWLAADLGVAWVLQRLASERAGGGTGADGGRMPLPALVWLWSPLVVVEVAWSGHLEPLGILPMLAAVWLAARPRRSSRDPRGLLAGALLGLGGAVKLAPLGGLPALWRRRGVAAAAAGLGVFLLTYLPHLGAGERLFAGLSTYLETWAFNAGLHRILEVAISPGAARALAAAAPAAAAAWAAWRAWPLDRALLWILGAALVLSPTVHPWYVLWVLPLAALRGGRAWIALSGLVFLAYWGRDAWHAVGVWSHPEALRWAIHAPFLALLGLEALRPQRLPGGGQVAGREEAGEGEGG